MSTLTGHATATNPQQRHRKEARIPLFIDASAPGARPARGDLGRGPVRRRQPGAVRDGRVQLPAGADRSRRAEERRRRDRHHRRLPQPRGADPSRGGGTSLTGGCCNVAVVMDWSKYVNKVLWVDPERKLARVQPGCVLDKLRGETEKHNLTFAPDPSTHNHCTLGGMIGNNSCGVHSLIGLGTGRTSDQIDELEIMLYDGTRMTVGATSEEELRADHRVGRPPRRDLRAAEGPPRPIRRPDPRPLSRTSPAGSRGTTSMTCCPRAASTSPGRWAARRGRASRSSRRSSTWCPARRCGRCWSSAIPTSSRRPRTSRRSSRPGRSAWRGSTTSWSRT